LKNQIKAHLRTLEAQKEIKILMAVEGGSRAWGFPSPDSDYDVRIIYIKQADWYLSIEDRPDTIDYFHGKLLDINGWDIRKALRLLKKSNATPFEWAQSPIVYFEEEGFRKDLLALSNQFFQPYHSINHYKGIAKNSYLKNPLSGAIKLKKLFYVIRPLFAVNWILAHQTIPPMDIHSLMEAVQEELMKTKITALIKLKETANEDFVYEIDPQISAYIETQFQRIAQVPLKKESSVPDVEVLNSFYRSLLKKYGA